MMSWININFGSRLILIAYLLCVSANHVVSNVNISATVTRRLSGDIYDISETTSHFSCDKDNATILVSDRRCVKNQDLISACSFSISPIMELSTFRVVITFGHHQNSTDDVERQTAVTFMSDNQSVTTAVVVATNQPANGSLCQIVSLEVYRGRRNITRIDHDGFFLSDEGMFRINRNNLPYDVDEYEGELYRMNISCTAEGLPRSGCLFFKVIGTTQVTNAKFNHSVQGTVDNNITSEPTITAMTTLTVTSQVTDLSTTSPMKGITTADSNTDMPLSASDRTDGSDLITTTAETVKTNRINDHGLQVGSFQYYIVVAAGSIVAVVALIAIVILIKIYIRNKKFKVSLEVVQRISRWRQRSRNLNIHVKETPSADISILPESDVDLTPAVESSSLEPPILSPPSESFADHEIIQEADRDRSLPPRKCDRIPVYIFLGPRESDPPIPKSPIECKQNLAYLHLGPEDNSTAASLQRKPITCKKNAAYIHLDPEDTSK